MAKTFGSVFVIDPLAAASLSLPSGNSSVRDGAKFPTTQHNLPTSALVSSRPWAPWGGSWPVRRITLDEAHTIVAVSSVADMIFTSHDDLDMEIPDQDDAPAIQRWEINDNNTQGNFADDIPLHRSWGGDYTWVATVTPPTAAARDALATDPASHYYNVSVVVFYKRSVSTTIPQNAQEAGANRSLLNVNERLTGAKIVSRGLSGGEVLLEPAQSEDFGDPFDGLKAGEWLMLNGPHPNTTPARPMYFLRWYRILSIEGEDTKLDANGNPVPTSSWDGRERRLVGLRGPAWPWEPAANLTSNNLSNDLRVGIFPSAVAVHSRSMRLEGNSRWNVD